LIVGTDRLTHDGILRARLHFHTAPNKAKLNGIEPLSRVSLDVPRVDPLRWKHLEYMKMVRSCSGTGAGIPLYIVLGQGMIFRSTNPRDKTFALLGIARDGHRLPFKLDYNESSRSS
jgi:hypothetical protein